MAQHVVIKTIFGKNISLKVAVVIQPVVCQLLGAKHQNRFVAQLVVLDHRQGRERFAKAHTVSQNAAAISLQLVDDAGRCVLLVIEKLVPNQRVLIASPVIWQNVFIDVFKELIEDVVEHQEVNMLR